MAIIDFFDQGWQINPKGTAYVLGDRSFSFDEIGRLSCQIAHALLVEGMKRETTIAVWSLNDPIAWACVLGLWRAGCAWVPLNPRSAIDENAHILEAFDCEVLFFQKGFRDQVEAIRPRLGKLTTLVCLEESAGGFPSLADYVRDKPSDRPAIDYSMDDVVAVAPTGGTTGAPKGVMNTNRVFQTFFAQLSIATSYRRNEPVINLVAAPMTHSAGMLTLPCSARGGTVVILTRPDPAFLLEAIERHHVTELFLPPTVIYALLSTPGVETRDFSSIRYFLYGAAPMSVEKLKQAIEVFGPVMMQAYGQMEAFIGISSLAPEDHSVGGDIAPDFRLSSCGRPFALTNVTIMNDQNAPVPVGQAGEICVRGDIVMKGYYKAPDKTAETIINGWLHTGDIGFVDDQGFLHITDRKKDMIITGGFNVYPSEVEQVIWGHPAVQDCAVIGVPDDKWGEAVKAVVELKPGLSADAGELIALCRDRLGGVKTPKTVDFMASLPRSPNGKVLKKDIREIYWQELDRRI